MFACFYIPDFAVQAALLPEETETRAALRISPLAILDGPANLPRVFAPNSAARRVGIETGMTKLQVETYGGVLLRKRSLAEEESAQAALVNFVGRFSPRVESTCPGAVILDLAGTEKLLGSWQNAARNMTAQAAEIGFEIRIATAANPDTAFLAARGFPVNHVSRPRPGFAWTGIFIPAGEEAEQLAPLAVDVLPISPEMLEILNSWGIRTFQSLAALPTVAVVERLGQDGLYLQKLARGEIDRPLLTVEANAEFVASFEFDDPVETLESLFFILNRLLQELCSKLLATALAAQELRLTVELEVRQKLRQIQRSEKEEEQYRHEWKLPAPTQDRSFLLGLVRLQLEKTTFTAPVRRLSLEVIPVKPRVAQENFFAPPSPEAEKLEITLERIRGVVGDADANGTACVGSPCLVDTYKPGSFVVQHFSSVDDGGHDSVNLPSTVAPVIALRIFRPALETSVELDGVRPHFVRLWSRHRRVLAASGPWACSGDWWNDSSWAREEWDVALKTPAGPGFYRIYRDRIRERWFVEGVFD
jgi:protein ImuB